MKNSKGERWARQIMRAELINLIFTCYEPFYMIKIQSECIKHQLSYSDAEKQADMYSEIFNLDCKATDLLYTDDDISNNILTYYERLQKSLSFIESRNFPFTKEDMMSFMEYEYHNNILLNMKHIEWINFSLWCTLAATRTVNIRDIIPMCVEYQIWDGGRVKQVDTKLFRRNFIRLEQDFWNIIAKRIVRSRNKQK